MCSYIVDQTYVVPFIVSYQSKYTKTIFVTKMSNPPVNLNWEHDHHVWISKDEMVNYSLVPGLPTTIKSLSAQGWLM